MRAARLEDHAGNLPAKLLSDLAGCGLRDVVASEGIGAIAPVPGAYVLLVGIELEVPISLAGRDAASLGAGWYAYCGSAKGPGGLRARLGRHFKPDKVRHWHIDRLTNNTCALAGLAVAGGDECALAQRLAASGAFAPAAPGFGSSDCRTCESHLMAWRGMR